MPILTERDLAILREHSKYAYMRKTQVHRALGDLAGSQEKLKRRLQTLVEHKYLLRPPNARVVLPGPNPEGVTTLGAAGARELERHDGLGLSLVTPFLYKNAIRTGAHIAHECDLVDLALSFRFDAPTGVTYLEDFDLIAGFSDIARAQKNPFLWPASAVPVPHKRNEPQTRDITLKPDKLVSLVLPEGRLNFVIELDRSLTIRAGSHGGAFRRQSNHWKVCAYLAGFLQGVHTRHYNWTRLRILMIERTERRRDMLAKLIQQITQDKLPGYFLIAHSDAIATRGVYAHDVWINARGQHVPLLPTA